eukprot:3164032-Prorocentrum_lima.AAC.1
MVTAWQGWRQWVGEATLKGGKAAHAFTKDFEEEDSPVDLAPLHGKAALQHLEDKWMGLWRSMKAWTQKPSIDDLAPLEPITLEQLELALA